MSMNPDKDPLIALSPEEYLWAVQGATIRLAQNYKNKLKSTNNANESVPEGLAWHVLGFAAELALAKYLGVFPSGAFAFGAADVGRDWEAKGTDRPDGRLILQRGRTNPEHRYVLLTGDGVTFMIRGWILGADALARPTTDAANNGRPAIWIPQNELHPVVLRRAA
jgi:hypothetical protein